MRLSHFTDLPPPGRQDFQSVTVQVNFLDFGLWRSYSAVTVSSAGPTGLFKGMTTATSGVIDRFPLLLPVRNPAVGYGASAVTRIPDRGHVAEVKKPMSPGWRGLNPGFQRNLSPP